MFKKSWDHLRGATSTYYELRALRAKQDERLFDYLLSDMHTLDAKSTGLITFISLALAALTFALSLVNETMEDAQIIKTGIISFIGIFSLAAWFSLRCLEISGPPFTKIHQDLETQKEQSITEIAVRRYNYYIALRITRYAFSILFVFVFIWIGVVIRNIY